VTNIEAINRSAPAAAELTGDYATLLGQLGDVPQGAASGATCLPVETMPGGTTWQTQLENYRDCLLVPLELPAIWRAWELAQRGAARELVRLDRELAAEIRRQPFADASLHAGRNQLRRLRPLRDARIVQRYLQAIEEGEAAGWHTLVYGLTLAVYSLPPREGMLTYARQTLGSFAQRSARGAAMLEKDVLAAIEHGCQQVVPVINSLVGSTVLQQPVIAAARG
jgi:urease accessory protein UreF